MALVMAFDDARTNRHRTFGNASKGVIGGTMTTPFFGSRARSDLPQANLNEHDPGRISTAHFHFVDQFQVVVAGRGKLGRHSLRPYSVHFSRAYTPYGPLIEDAASGTTMFVLRARPDPGPHHLPQGRDVLKQIKDRQPWQVTCTFDLPPIDASGTSSGLGLQLIPGVKDEAGLAAYTLQMNASVTQRVPDPSTGGGQYIVVLKGSFLHDSKEHKALALVFVKPEEEPYVLQAGTDGLEALVLNFPRETIQPGMAKAGLQQGARSWRCMLCAFVYDEMAGMPGDGISPGTAWTDVPETWVCPDCGASKTDFRIDE